MNEDKQWMIKVEHDDRPTSFFSRIEIVNHKDYPIATVFDLGPYQWENATLIKAAPSLYAACQSALNALCGVPVDETQSQAREELRAALNEASRQSES